MLPVSPEAYPAAGWTRQTRTESLLLMELFPPLHLQFEQSFSYTPAYCSDRPLGSRVCRIFWSSLGIGSDTRWDQNPLVSGRALSLWGRRALASQAARGRAVSNVTIHNSGFT